ncbi:MAG: flagellar cap protein FliD [Rhodoferax ferrireducens]|uniref:Flagellar hook-associated protein 2 n=1 Tax=Rhodoferax ferrireducens TaxID=192843 RepID=A0A1W9KRI8_9BURK|nr:MAG: flagellar cap protein FliD [Rhodoferax ferrireducens]
MATISSVGIGSGLDVKSIVSQLVALEKQPLSGLQVKAATINTRISAFGQVKSLVSALSGAAGTLNSLTTWNAVTASSSNTTGVTASAVGGTQSNAFTFQVTALAAAQSYASQALPLPAGTAIGSGGTLNITMAGATSPVEIEVAATDSVSDIASKINGSDAGVTAAVLNDASGERLLLRSKTTGVANGFTVTVTDNDLDNANDAGLSKLVFGASTVTAVDAAGTINGSINVTSATNTFSDVVSGVTLTAKEVMTSAADITVGPDRAAVTSAVDAFVKAYNDINSTLQELTKYDAGTKSAGLLQGDTTAISLQNAIRGVLQSTTSGSAYARLADVGITAALGGALSVDSTKFNAALDNGDEVKNLFTIDNSNTLTNGFALKFKTFSEGLLATDGFFSSKDASLKRSLDANAKDQTRLNEKVARVEAALNRRYSALDAQMASLSALNAYVTQQVTLWNKSTG